LLVLNSLSVLVDSSSLWTSDREIVVLCAHWYLSFKLSYRDLVTMMTERGIDLAHMTILRWVQRYTPEFAKRWKRFAPSLGELWRCSETYISNQPHAVLRL
jgi:putative transposase